MVNQSDMVPQRVRSINYRFLLLACLVSMAGMGIGLYWWLTGSGLYAWLVEWQQALWGGPVPALAALLAIILPFALCLAVGFLLVSLSRSMRYEIPLPFTSCPMPARNITVIRFSEVEAQGEGMYRVPGGQVFDFIESHLGEPGWQTVLVNLSGMDFLPQKALVRLIVLHKKLTGLGGQLVLCNLHPQIRKVFEITKLDKILSIYGSEAEYVGGNGDTLRSPISS
jgi:anti-anti-sigma factor